MVVNLSKSVLRKGRRESCSYAKVHDLKAPFAESKRKVRVSGELSWVAPGTSGPGGMYVEAITVSLYLMLTYHVLLIPNDKSSSRKEHEAQS